MPIVRSSRRLSYLRPAFAPWQPMETYFHHQPWEVSGAPGFNLKAQASCSSCLVSFVESPPFFPGAEIWFLVDSSTQFPSHAPGPRRLQPAPRLTPAAHVSAEPRLNASLGMPLHAQTEVCRGGHTGGGHRGCNNAHCWLLSFKTGFRISPQLE